MTRLFIVILIAAATSACNNSEKGNSPETLEEIEKALTEKRITLAELQGEIEVLEEKQLKLNPGMVERKVVRINTLKPLPFQTTFKVQGLAETKNNILVSSETNGLVMNVNVTEGQPVRRGQLLMSIDAGVLQKNIEEVKNSLELATTVYKRQANLRSQNIGSEIQYLEAKNNKEALERRLATLNAEMNKARVRSPIDGIVDEIIIRRGENAMPGSPLIRIVNTGDIHIRAEVTESKMGAVRKGDKVRVVFPNIPGYSKEAYITAVSQVISPINRTFRIEVAIDNEDGFIKSNLLSTIEIREFHVDSAIVLSQQTIQQDRSGNYFVYTVGSEGPQSVARKRIIQPGRSHQGRTMILQGLEPGELIVTAGAREITDNSPIIIQH